jgi:hypothetical protein
MEAVISIAFVLTSVIVLDSLTYKSFKDVLKNRGKI